MRCGAIVPAAGRSRRMGETDKTTWLLAGRPVLAWVLDVLVEAAIEEIVVVASEQNEDAVADLIGSHPAADRMQYCRGGETRQDSVAAGLARLSAEVDLVLIHDAARPLVTRELIEAGVTAGRALGAAIAAIPVSDTIKRVGADGTVICTPNRDELRAVQTPQVFRRDWLEAAYAAAAPAAPATDEATLLERAGFPVHVYPGSPENIKLTTPEDLVLAEALVRRRMHRCAP